MNVTSQDAPVSFESVAYPANAACSTQGELRHCKDTQGKRLAHTSNAAMRRRQERGQPTRSASEKRRTASNERQQGGSHCRLCIPAPRTCDGLVHVLRLDLAVRHGAHLQQQPHAGQRISTSITATTDTSVALFRASEPNSLVQDCAAMVPQRTCFARGQLPLGCTASGNKRKFECVSGLLQANGPPDSVAARFPQLLNGGKAQERPDC